MKKLDHKEPQKPFQMQNKKISHLKGLTLLSQHKSGSLSDMDFSVPSLERFSFKRCDRRMKPLPTYTFYTSSQY